MAGANLDSPTGIFAPLRLRALERWLKRELMEIPSAPIRNVVRAVCANLDDFISWPVEALLLWKGCNRISAPGEKLHHRYPEKLKSLFRTKRIGLDNRPNGPAIAAFQLAGGTRHPRLGSRNAWSVHHVYSGKFPFHGRNTTLHAVKNELQFTQSAGLIAAHPIADNMCDEFPLFAWLLRAHAFRRFGYDPDGVFSERQSSFGFAIGSKCRVIYCES